jgi:transcriptional regulator with XRE-family HTH domain
VGEANAWSMALVRAITTLRDARGLTNQELVDRTEMSASYYYARLRGASPFDTNDIQKLAVALGTHPHEISRVAASFESDENIEPRRALDPVELARRLNLIVSTPRADGSSFDESDLILELSNRGVDFDSGDWVELLSGHAGNLVSVRMLEAVAWYADVPAAYLIELADADTAEACEAQFDFRSAVRESGATISARAVGDVSPAALRAIANSIRSIPPR